MVNFEFHTSLLVALNVVQMVSIMVLVLPIIDIVVLSKNLKRFTNDAKHSPVAVMTILLYGFCILYYGIINPMKLFNDKSQLTTPNKKLRHIIDVTNASRNYLLAGLSLFFVLVIVRLCDYVHFSAKLHEFSELMRNYNLIDIAYTTEGEKDLDQTTIFEESFKSDEESVHWPSTVDFTKSEHRQIQTFLKATPRKTETKVGSETDNKSIEEKDSNENKNENKVRKTSLEEKDSKKSLEENICKDCEKELKVAIKLLETNESKVIKKDVKVGNKPLEENECKKGLRIDSKSPSCSSPVKQSSNTQTKKQDTKLSKDPN